MYLNALGLKPTWASTATTPSRLIDVPLKPLDIISDHTSPEQVATTGRQCAAEEENALYEPTQSVTKAQTHSPHPLVHTRHVLMYVRLGVVTHSNSIFPHRRIGPILG